MRDNNPDPTEHNIITAGAHLLNLDNQLKNAYANGDSEVISKISKQKDETSAVLRQLGNNAGRNLGLFNLVFKDVSDNEIKVTRDHLKKILGVEDVPETLEKLKNSNLSNYDKIKVEPYVRKIEEFKKVALDQEIKSNNNIKSINDEEVKKALHEAQEAGKREGIQALKDKPGRTKLSLKIKDVAKQLRHSDEMDKFLNVNNDIHKMGLDLGSYKEIIANLLEGAAKIIEAGENVHDYLKGSIEKYNNLDKKKLLSDVQMLMSRSSLPDKQEIINKIKTISSNENSKTITKNMVESGLIKQFVTDHIHTNIPYEKVIEESTKELKKYLPNVTVEDVSDAFVRRNDFKMESRQQFENTIKEKTDAVKKLSIKQSRLKSLEAAEEYHNSDDKIEKEKIKSSFEKLIDDKIADLKKQQQSAKNEKSQLQKINYEVEYVKVSKEVFLRAIKSPKTSSDAIKAARAELNNLYNENGLRLEREGRKPIKIEQEYQKAIKEIDNNDELSDKEREDKKAEIKQQRDFDLKGTKQGVISHLQDDIRDLKKGVQSDNAEFLNKKLNNIIDGLKPSGENLEDQGNKAFVKLTDLLDDKNLSKEDKASLKEVIKNFENNNQLTADELKANKLKKQWENQINSANRNINTKNFINIPQTPYDFRRSIELSNLNRVRNNRSGKLTRLIADANEKNKSLGEKGLDLSNKFLVSGYHTIQKVAEAATFKPMMDSIVETTTGRLSSLITDVPYTTLNAIKKGFKTYAAFKDSASAEKWILKLQNEKTNALTNLEQAHNFGDDKKIKKAETEFKKADLEYGISTLYKSIDANSLKTFWEYMAHGATDYDEEIGKGTKKNIKDYRTALEKTGYVLDGWIRTHAALKTSISARPEMMRSFASTLTDFQKKGKPLDDKHISLAMVIASNDYEYGRLTNKTTFSKFISRLKTSENSTASRIVTKTIAPVSTIAINITKRGFDYSTLGAEGWARLASQTKKAMGLNEAEGKTYDTWSAKIKDAISKIPLQERKYINGVISRGMFGAATSLITLYGLSTGNIKYGGTWDDQRRRKIIGEDGMRLKAGEWEFFGWRAPKLFNAFLNHTPESLNIALTANLYQIDMLDKGEGKEPSDQIKTIAGEIESRLPFQTLIGLVNRFAETITDRFTRIPIANEIGNALDPDTHKREKKTLGERVRSNTGFGFLNPLK